MEMGPLCRAQEVKDARGLESLQRGLPVRLHMLP